MAKAAASAPPTTLSVLAYAKHLLISAHDLLEYKQRDWTLLCVISCNDGFYAFYLTLLGQNAGKFLLRVGRAILPSLRLKFSLHLYPP